MKHLFFIVCSCLVYSIGFPQVKSNDERQIIRLENKWMQAMMHKDSATCNNIMHPSFIIQGINDLDRPAVNKATWMNNTLHHLNVDSIHFSTIKIDVLENTAIARSSFYWSAAFDGQKFTDSVHMVDLWIKMGEQWFVVNRMVADNH